MKRFRARIIQEFTIIAEDEEKAKYAAIHRVSRFADMGGIDEKAGKWKARAHDPVLDSLVVEEGRTDSDATSAIGEDRISLSEGARRKADANGIGEDRLQSGDLLDYGDSSGGSDSPADEVDRTGGIF